jgi:hypothetical protein
MFYTKQDEKVRMSSHLNKILHKYNTKDIENIVIMSTHHLTFWIVRSSFQGQDDTPSMAQQKNIDK